MTGTSAEKHPGFMLMYADALAGKFDKIATREVSRFVKAVVVYKDHFDWYLRTDGSNDPIVCNVKGRSNGKKTFVQPSEVSPLGLPPHRPPLRI